MDRYVTGAMIKRLREKCGLTQTELAEKLKVGDKAVSKWETGRGYPDISLIEPLAASLGVSVIELFAGQDTVNTNRAFNMLRSKFYACPICGNIIFGTGEAVVSCWVSLCRRLKPRMRTKRIGRESSKWRMSITYRSSTK